jgi:EpsI family protein
MRLAVALGFLGLNFYIYHFLASGAVIPERRTFDEFPLELGAWACAEPERMTPEIEANLGVTDYLICNFERRDPRDLVSLYVGYHATQVREEGGGAAENSIHPPAHCLPGSGWDVISARTVLLEVPGLPQSPAPVKRLVIAKGDHRSIVYYWYQSRGRIIAEDWKKILYMGFDRATQRRTDGSLVRFTIPLLRGDEERADTAFRELAPRVLERLPEFVPG